jgi:hypothetical protein
MNKLTGYVIGMTFLFCLVTGSSVFAGMQVAGGYGHTVGLEADGTVVAVGDNTYGQCNVSGWSGIVQVSAGSYHTIGLKADGSVVAVGYNSYGQCNVSGWCLGSDCDGDGIEDSVDNCSDVYNTDQHDADGNGKGDVCDDLTGFINAVNQRLALIEQALQNCGCSPTLV